MSAVDALLYPSFVLGADGAIAAILTAGPALPGIRAVRCLGVQKPRWPQLARR